MKSKIKNLIKTKGGPYIVALVIILGFLAYNQYDTANTLEKTNSTLRAATNNLEQKISDIEIILLAAQEKNLTLDEALAAAKEKAEDLEKQFGEVNDNVDELEKIATTDRELLQKYSKVYFLNEHYAPADLDTIDSQYGYEKNRKYEIHDEVLPYLEDLLEEADDDGLNLMVISAFRSFSDQAILKGAYTVTYGAGTANQFSADQGYSEHQLGTTVDFTTPTVGATFSGFANTPEYAWLQKNAYKYGFTLSYPKDNEFYEFEPWHWRFVGKKLARDLHKDEQFFYDLSQREIDKYIVNLFD